jgi:tetratricopeptide (TPR) repeat protein
MKGDVRCRVCGQTIPPGVSRCPTCKLRKRQALRQDTILLLCLPVMAVLLAVTGFAVKVYDAKQQALSAEWAARGRKALASGHPQEAVEAFRTAVLYSHDNSLIELHLAQALLAANRTDEARDYLLRLWEDNPADGPVNLELGRVALRNGNVTPAIRYYHSAIDGVWPDGSEAHRRPVREELCEALLARGMRTEALAELAALSAETPNDAGLVAQVGDLFLRADEYDVALRQFNRALSLNHNLESARKGAGIAAYEVGDYRTARHYLLEALSGDPKDSEIAQMLNTADFVLELDPYYPGLSSSARRTRVLRIYHQALDRTKACAPQAGESLKDSQNPSPLGDAYLQGERLLSKATNAALRRNPDLEDDLMKQAFQLEEASNDACGAPKGIDEAIVLIARKSKGSR